MHVFEAVVLFTGAKLFSLLWALCLPSGENAVDIHKFFLCRIIESTENIDDWVIANYQLLVVFTF